MALAKKEAERNSLVRGGEAVKAVQKRERVDCSEKSSRSSMSNPSMSRPNRSSESESMEKSKSSESESS